MNENIREYDRDDPDEVLIIRDPATLKVLADPLRIEILRAFREPTTVKSVAAQLDLPPTKLYYHVNQLERHHLIRVVATKIVSGIIEKTYQVRARSIQVDDGLFSADAEALGEQLESLLAIVFDSSKREALRSLKAGLLAPRAEPADLHGILSRGLLKLTPAQAHDLEARLTALQKEFEGIVQQNDAGDDLLPFNLTVAFYQIAAEDGKQTNVS